MLNRTKVSTGIVALALLVSAPLEATETPEADAPYAALTLEVAATAACAEVASLTGVLSCPEGAEAAAAEAAESACARHGMWVDEFEVDCWHLGGGVWYFSARYSCTREIIVKV